MQKSQKRNIIIWICLLIVGISFLSVYFFIDPSESVYMPKCLFYQLTGYKCIGCGMQRAFYYALHGNLREAISMNLFLIISMPVILIYFLAEIFRNRFPRIYVTLNSKYILIALGILAVSWWIIRNILNI